MLDFEGARAVRRDFDMAEKKDVIQDIVVEQKCRKMGQWDDAD
jgi:hypothetical protein